MKKDFAKKLIGSAAAHIKGSPVRLQFTGNQKTVSIAENVVNASKQLYETLNDESSTLDIVREKINKKRIAANEFRQCFGFSWPL
tara:strand:+ start:66474 stop:66728 length:255 start_codon:yes stop_codon:yes gene_type:complete